MSVRVTSVKVGWSVLFAVGVALPLVSGCLGARKAKFDSAAASSSENVTGNWDPSWADSSGMDGKGGVKVSIAPGSPKKLLPLVKSDFDKNKKGDESIGAHPDWQLFYGAGDQSLSFEYEWVTTEKDKHYDKTWGGCGIAFNGMWGGIDGSGAKYVVFWVKSSIPKPPVTFKLHSTSKSKGQEETGDVALLQFATGGELSDKWQRIVIPISEFPDVDKVDLSALQWVGFDLRGNDYAENTKIQLQIDNIYLSDADMVTPVTNPGYLARSDGALLVWDKDGSKEKIEGFVITADGKEIETVDADKRSALIPSSKLTGKSIKVGIATKGSKETSEAATVTVKGGQSSAEAVTVKLSAPTHEVSPYIFGTNYGPDSVVKHMGATVRRWGGNGVTKYNWKYDVGSSASDWYFLNGYSKKEGTPDEEMSWFKFIKQNRDDGADVNLTIPIIDRIAKAASDDKTRLCSYPASKYPKQEAIGGEGCGNGKTPDGKEIWGNDMDLSTTPNSPEYQKGWIERIVKHFGTASKGGVKFYTMDNEPGLWNSTHRDVMPKGISSEDLVDHDLKYAAMVKSVDPSAKVIGFSAWGVMELAGSNVDYTPPGPDGYKRYQKFKDEAKEKFSEVKKHGGDSQLIYMLKKFKEAEDKGGKRLIDALDIHWYPELYTKDWKRLMDDLPYDAKIAKSQWEALREWYDPTFASEGADYMTWTDDGELNKKHLWDPHHPVIPAIKKFIDTYYPGTKLAINEYDTGSRSHYHGGLLRIAALGIFMQEDLWMAQNWYQMDKKAFQYWGQKLYSNYDDKGGHVKGKFVPSESSNKDLLSFVTVDGGKYYAMLVNKNPSKRMQATVELPQGAKGYKAFRLVESLGKRIFESAGSPPKGNQLSVDVPAYSAVLVVTN